MASDNGEDSRTSGDNPHGQVGSARVQVRPLWADEHPLALQTLVDPTIRVSDEDLKQWSLPAGWVEVVNRLHVGLQAVLGEYWVVGVSNKMSSLRYSIDRYGREAGPGVYDAVAELLAKAKAESLATCSLCGAPANGSVSPGTTRCEEHPTTGESRGRGALARPPGRASSSLPPAPASPDETAARATARGTSATSPSENLEP